MDVQRSLLLICHSKTFSGQCAKTQLLSAVKCISWPERVRWGESKKVSILIFVDFLLVDFTSSLMLLYTEDLCVGQWQWISYFILGTCCFIYIQINKDKHSRNIKIITLDKFTQKHTHTHIGKWPLTYSQRAMWFEVSTSLVLHCLTPTGQHPRQCPKCNKTLLNSGEPLLHNQIHFRERPSPCSYCDRRFWCSSGLAMHIWTHTLEHSLKEIEY